MSERKTIAELIDMKQQLQEKLTNMADNTNLNLEELEKQSQKTPDYFNTQNIGKWGKPKPEKLYTIQEVEAVAREAVSHAHISVEGMEGAIMINCKVISSFNEEWFARKAKEIGVE